MVVTRQFNPDKDPDTVCQCRGCVEQREAERLDHEFWAEQRAYRIAKEEEK